MIKLSETRDKDGKIIPEKLEEFIAERKGQKGNKVLFDATLREMAEKSSEAHQASSQDGSDD